MSALGGEAAVANPVMRTVTGDLARTLSDATRFLITSYLERVPTWNEGALPLAGFRKAWLKPNVERRSLVRPRAGNPCRVP